MTDGGDKTLTDEATQIKKRARRRLIGAAALALFAAIILPMVMDHQPAPPLKDIQVRIPSPDEGMTQRLSPSPAAVLRKNEDAKAMPPPVEPAKPIAKPVPESPPESRTEQKPAPKPDTEAKAGAGEEAGRAQEALAGKASAESWEIQLGAYQNATSVNNLLGKLKQLGVPAYTEKVDTPNGARTRVRAGPFPNRDAAEKARTRIKIIGVDGPVAQRS